MIKKQYWILLPIFVLFLLVTSRQNVRYTYTRTIETSLTPEQLWNVVTTAFTDSTATQYWPNGLETVTTDALSPQGVITVQYILPFGTSQQRYRIADIRYGILTYQTDINHPLQGGGTVSIIPRVQGSALSWRIEYSYSIFSPIGWYARIFYTPAFFNALSSKFQ